MSTVFLLFDGLISISTIKKKKKSKLLSYNRSLICRNRMNRGCIPGTEKNETRINLWTTLAALWENIQQVVWNNYQSTQIEYFTLHLCFHREWNILNSGSWFYEKQTRIARDTNLWCQCSHQFQKVFSSVLFTLQQVVIVIIFP